MRTYLYSKLRLAWTHLSHWEKSENMFPAFFPSAFFIYQQPFIYKWITWCIPSRCDGEKHYSDNPDFSQNVTQWFCVFKHTLRKQKAWLLYCKYMLLKVPVFVMLVYISLVKINYYIRCKLQSIMKLMSRQQPVMSRKYVPFDTNCRFVSIIRWK